MRKMRCFCIMLACLSLFSGCRRNSRFDYSELSRRLGEVNESFSFRESDLFFSDGTYYVYYGFTAENDMLLTLKEDETGLLSEVTLSLDGDCPDAVPIFRTFSLVLADLFIPDVDGTALAAELGLDIPDEILSARTARCACGFYRADFFGTEQGAVFALKYGELYEKST